MMLGCGASFLGPPRDRLFRQMGQQTRPASETSAGKTAKAATEALIHSQLPVLTAGLPSSSYCTRCGARPNRGDSSHSGAPLVHPAAHLFIPHGRTRWLRDPGSCHTQSLNLSPTHPL